MTTGSLSYEAFLVRMRKLADYSVMMACQGKPIGVAAKRLPFNKMLDLWEDRLIASGDYANADTLCLLRRTGDLSGSVKFLTDVMGAGGRIRLCEELLEMYRVDATSRDAWNNWVAAKKYLTKA